MQKIAALFSLLRCLLCTEYMTMQIYQCSKGHSICRNCKLKISTCSFCNADLGGIRNYAVEMLLEILWCKFPTFNTPSEANDIGFNFQEEIRKVFIDRLYDCRINSTACSWSGQRNKLQQHIKDNHKRKWWSLDLVTTQSFKIASTEDVYLVYYRQNQFCLYRKEQGGIMFWCLQAISAVNPYYYYSINIHSSKMFPLISSIPSPSNEKEIEWTEKCILNDMLMIDDIIEAGLCSGISVDLLKTLANFNGDVYCTLTISRNLRHKTHLNRSTQPCMNPFGKMGNQRGNKLNFRNR